MQILANIFNDFLFVCIVSHLRYTFPMPIKVSSYVKKQNKFPYVPLWVLVVNHVKDALYAYMCQISSLLLNVTKNVSFVI